jgi:hypothetical protein
MKKIEAQDLIQDYFHLHVQSLNDIVFLGKDTVKRLKESWQYKIEENQRTIKETGKALNMLKGINKNHIREMAEAFENPSFPNVGVPKEHNWSTDIEPLDADSLCRPRAATTFNCCGWCKYAYCGSGRYNYYITTECEFNARAGRRKYGEKRFDTPCFLKDASDVTFAALRFGLITECKKLTLLGKELSKKVRILEGLERNAERKPAIANSRAHDWFNIGDPIVSYVGNWGPDNEKIIDKDFVTGKVINGYRHHDGCISVCYDEKVHSGNYLEGRGGGFGMSRPEIMHKWEFEYMLRNPLFISVFSNLDELRLEGFDRTKFNEAMYKEVSKYRKAGGKFDVEKKIV